MASENNSVWEFNCPQYVDFQSAAEDHGTDSYFDIDHELRNSVGLKNAGNSLPARKTEGAKSTSDSLRTKRKPLGVLQAHDINQKKNYELRLTPYRGARPKSYCSVHVASPKEPSASINHENISVQENKYCLRMTPARKRKTKSCFMYREDHLVAEKCLRAYNSDDDEVSSIKSGRQSEDEGCEVDADPVNTIPVAGRSSNNSRQKRTASPLPGSLLLKRAKLSISQPQKFQKKQLSDQDERYKTTEERELMKIRQSRYELARQRRRNEKYMNKAKHANFSRKINDSTVSQHTVVKPFHFKTDERVKDNRAAGEYKRVDFSSILRRQSPRNTKPKSKPGLTKFQPFNFVTDKRIPMVPKMDDEGTKKKTVGLSSLPHSPNLKAVKRNRPITALSRQQEEELEVQEIKKYKFQAKDFNPNVFSRVILPKITTKPSTRPEAVELATEKRFKNKEVKKSTEEKFEFHAQPVPKQILAAPIGLKPKRTIPSTEPKSPTFALKLRSQKWKEHPSVLEDPSEHQVSIFKAHPVPEFKAPALLKSAKKCTVLEPFSFDQKDQARAQKKEQKVYEEIEKQRSMCYFKAQPVPDLSGTSGIPKKEAKPVTMPEPFQLHIDKLATQKIDKWQKEIEHQLSKDREAAIFKANPALVTKKPPFQPEKSGKPLTVSNSFPFATEKRAEERAKFQDHLQAINAENTAYQLRSIKERERKEKEEIAVLRKEIVHKAKPIPHYKPFEIKPSEKPLTEPSSLHFATDLRIKQRM